MGASSFALFVTFGAICVGSLVVGQLLDFQFVQPPLFLPNDVVTTIQPTIEDIGRRNGYPVDRHHVTTVDGYILAIHHIVKRTKQTSGKKRPVALLVCGIAGTPAVYMVPGKGKSLAFLLTDLGYDVWLTNNRGTTWSRRHVNLDPEYDKAKFWNYTFHEIGIYDLPAAIDYVLQKTKSEKLHFVGHSQGTSVFFVMTSERPEYNSKIRLMTALAPVVYMEYVRNHTEEAHMDIEPMIVSFGRPRLKNFTVSQDVYGFIEHDPMYTLLGYYFCSDKSPFQSMCVDWALHYWGADDREQMNKTLMPYLLEHIPAGMSKKQGIHFRQILNSGRFEKFDYGREKNLEFYGSEIPPEYDLKNVTAPVALYYGKNDLLVDTRDVDKLARILPNVVEKYLVEYKMFSHADFVLAKDVVPLVYNRVIEVMNKF